MKLMLLQSSVMIMRVVMGLSIPVMGVISNGCISQ